MNSIGQYYESSHGYNMIYLPNNPMADKWGMVYEHRLMASIKLNRLLLPTEVVHHIDGNKQNNDFENLMVFKTNSDHSAFHKGCKVYLDGDVYVSEKTFITRIGKDKKDFCPICGELKSITSKYCCNCYEKYERRKTRKVINRPSKDELWDLVTKFSFNEIGRKYNVNGNTIKKWCKNYGLPYLKSEINNMTLLNK